LKAAFNVPTLETQKLIKRKEVSPIISQPKNNITILPEETNNNILIIKDKRNNKKRSINGSYLK
jgi:hypothetical protein